MIYQNLVRKTVALRGNFFLGKSGVFRYLSFKATKPFNRRKVSIMHRVVWTAGFLWRMKRVMLHYVRECSPAACLQSAAATCWRKFQEELQGVFLLLILFPVFVLCAAESSLSGRTHPSTPAMYRYRPSFGTMPKVHYHTTGVEVGRHKIPLTFLDEVYI